MYTYMRCTNSTVEVWNRGIFATKINVKATTFIIMDKNLELYTTTIQKTFCSICIEWQVCCIASSSEPVTVTQLFWTHWRQHHQTKNSRGSNEEAGAENSSKNVDIEIYGILNDDHNRSDHAGNVDGKCDVFCVIQAFDFDLSNGESKYQGYNLRQHFVAIEDTKGDVTTVWMTDVHKKICDCLKYLKNQMSYWRQFDFLISSTVIVYCNEVLTWTFAHAH